jgi:hypothetical protein
MLACDFFVTVTARFQVLYVFVIMEVGCRRITHFNVTAHPTGEWTLQQFRETISGEELFRYLIHDRDRIYSRELDSGLKAMGLRIFKTPFRAPQCPPEWGFSLPVVYIFWVCVVIGLYPLCPWFAAVKQRRSNAWLSYF